MACESRFETVEHWKTPEPNSGVNESAISGKRSKHHFGYAAVFLAAILLMALAHVPILRGIASFLIVEDSLRPAAAIVALGGQAPFREIEAAKLYHAELAPQVVIVREAPTAESQALQQLGVRKVPQWELARAVLIQQGVPPQAIVIPEDDAVGTLEELQAVWGALGARSWVFGVEPVIGRPSSVAPANATNAERNNVNNALPVILVTSKYHTRRTRLTWQYVSGGLSQPIVRAASGDPFDQERWWQTRSFVLSVVREYLGLFNYYLGFPVTP